MGLLRQKRGREVEFPLGKLKVVRHRHRKQEGNFLGRKRTIYRRRYTVVHELDAKGDKLLNPPPKPRRPAVVLPPRPAHWSEKEQDPEKVITRRRRIPHPKVVEEQPKPVLIDPSAKGRFKLTPPPRGWPTKPIVLNTDPSLGPVGLPLRPGVKKKTDDQP